MTPLTQKVCVPCQGGVPPLKGSELLSLYEQLPSGWKLVNEHHLVRNYEFKDFQEALDFTNKVGQLAEKEGHHPDIGLGWGYVNITTFTHKIDGLTESDFILAAKIEQFAD
jgi:4a-hydroxytetrahydrobiopterin dehydratase